MKHLPFAYSAINPIIGLHLPSGSLDLPSQIKLSLVTGKVAGALALFTLAWLDLIIITLISMCSDDTSKPPMPPSPSTGSGNDDDAKPIVSLLRPLSLYNSDFILSHVSSQWIFPLQSCVSGWLFLLSFSTLLIGHAFLSFRMARQASMAQLMLNPVSSGLVQI